MSPVMVSLRRAALEESLLLRVEAGWRPSPGWRARRGCVGAEVEDFYARWQRGAKLCIACPVRLDCLSATVALELVASEGQAAEYVVVGYTAIPADRRARYIIDHRPEQQPVGERCGSDPGYYDHRRAGQQTCQPCRDAHTAAQKQSEARSQAQRREAATSTAHVAGTHLNATVHHYDFGDRMTA